MRHDDVDMCKPSLSVWWRFHPEIRIGSTFSPFGEYILNAKLLFPSDSSVTTPPGTPSDWPPRTGLNYEVGKEPLMDVRCRSGPNHLSKAFFVSFHWTPPPSGVE